VLIQFWISGVNDAVDVVVQRTVEVHFLGKALLDGANAGCVGIAHNDGDLDI
jgi:hypothetical protein